MARLESLCFMMSNVISFSYLFLNEARSESGLLPLSQCFDLLHQHHLSGFERQCSDKVIICLMLGCACLCVNPCLLPLFGRWALRAIWHQRCWRPD